MAQLLVI
jgi:hypothetical protein